MALEKAIRNAFAKALARRWDRIYIAYDVHETILEPSWDRGSLPNTFYPHAKRVCQYLTKRKDIISIIWTSSHQHDIEEYLSFFESHGIHFHYVNENPEMKDSVGCFDVKMYMNLLLDDKAGFDWETDWLLLEEILKNEFPENYLQNAQSHITEEQIREMTAATRRRHARNFYPKDIVDEDTGRTLQDVMRGTRW